MGVTNNPLLDECRRPTLCSTRTPPPSAPVSSLVRQRTAPVPTPAFFQNYIQIVSGIRLCIEKRLIAPALILIYATIDSYAWAASDTPNATVRSRFEAFVRDWMLPNHPLPCSPTDLYGARCAILHTLTAYSDLSDSKKAKPILYAWGTANASSLGEVLEHAEMRDGVCLHIEDLANALFEAMVAVTEKATTDSQLNARLKEAAGRHYKDMEKGTVEEFLQRIHGRSAV